MGSSVRLLRSLVQSVGGGVSYSSGEVKDRKVVVDSDLPGIVYVRIVEEVARKGGKRRVVGKERRDGGMLSGKGSRPTVVARRAVVDNANVRFGLVSEAHGAKNLELERVGLWPNWGLVWAASWWRKGVVGLIQLWKRANSMVLL